MSASSTIIVVHGEDVDGIISGAFLLRYYGLDTKIHLVSYAKQQSFFKQLSYTDLSGFDVVVADLSLKPTIFFALEKICQSAKSLTWLDHHQCDLIADFRALGACYIDGSLTQCCGADLCLDWLSDVKKMSIDANAFKQLELAVVSDYPAEANNVLEITKAGELQRLISYYNYTNNAESLLALIKTMASSAQWEKQVQRDYSRVEKIFVLAERQINQHFFQIGDHQFLLALVHPILPQKEVLRKLRSLYIEDVSACIGVFPGSAMNALVFACLPGFPVIEFCQSLGGGGRENDGGFSLDKNLDWTTLDKAVSQIKIYLKTFLDKVS